MAPHLGWEKEASKGSPTLFLHTEFVATPESTTETKEPKKAKRVRRKKEAPLCAKEMQHEGLQLDFRKNYLNMGADPKIGRIV